MAQRYVRENLGKGKKKEPQRGHATTKNGLVDIIDLLPAGFVLHDAAVLPQITKIETARNERRQYYERGC